MDRIDGGSRFSAQIPWHQDTISQSVRKVESEPKIKETEQVQTANEKAELKNEQYLLNGNTYLQFSVHKESNDIVIKVLDKDTGETVKEIPSEKLLDIVSKIVNSKGILFDEKL